MSDTARDYQTIDAASTEGIDSLFEDANSIETVHELNAIASTTVRELVEYIDVEEAAKRLGISVRAVQKRLKKGSLIGSKLRTGALERWVIDASCLPPITTFLSPKSTLIELDANSIELVREPLDDVPEMDANLLTGGREQGANQDAKDYRDELIKDLQHKLEAASYRLGYLEHQLETQTDQIKLLTDRQHKTGWWARFSSWFFQSK